MRICFVSSELAGFRGGGIGTYVAEAGKALTTAGHEVWLVTRDPGRNRRAELSAHPAFHRVVLARRRRERRDSARGHAPAAYAYSHWVHESLQAAGVDFDYIEFPDFGAEGYVALREHRLFGAHASAVLAVTLHSPTWETQRFNRQLHLLKPRRREVCVLEDDAIRNAPVLCSPSHDLLSMVTKRLDLGRPGRVVRYPMELPPPPAPPDRRSGLAALRFLYFGRIEPRKGVENLVEAFRQLPELSIDLVGGDGPWSPHGTSHVAWLSRRLPRNVRIFPALPRGDLLQRLVDADVVILPSLWENWPNACIEAMAAARVVIASRHGGMSEMVEHGRSGFLVDGRDPADIVRVVREELAANLDRLPELGAAAATRIRTLSDPRTYVGAIERLVAETSVDAPPRSGRPRGHRVSIVVTTDSDGAGGLQQALASATAQTHEDLDLCVVDDRAGDGLDAAAQHDPRIRVLPGPGTGAAAGRNLGLEHADGDYVVFVDAGDTLDRDCVATLLTALEAAPGAFAIVPECEIVARHRGEGGDVAAPLPFDRALAVYANEFGGPGAMFRVADLREHGLRFDPQLARYAEWGWWVDCARTGLRVEQLPRVLCARHMARAGPPEWEQHLALLGLLIEHHLARDLAADETQLLITLLQGWSSGESTNMHAQALRYRLVDALARGAGRVPGLTRSATWLARQALRVHGRFKDRRLPT